MIHKTAIIDAGAKIGSNVSVGPYSVIGADVQIGDDSWIGPHVVIKGQTKIGRANRIYQFSSIGEDPQDKKFSAGGRSSLEIGDGNLIREYCSINRGTEQGGGKTVVGSNNWIMAYVHIAHDCQVGNDIVFSNNVGLAGHVSVSDYVVMGGFTAVHQFCSIGRYCFAAGYSAIAKDVPPFLMVSGFLAKPTGLNREGLKRYGFSQENINLLRRLYRIVYRSGLRREQINEALKEFAAESEIAAEFSDFIAQSTRGIVR